MLATEEDTVDVNGIDRMNFIERDLFRILTRRAAFDPGIVDDNVNGAEPLRSHFGGTFPIRLLGGIESRKKRFALDRVRGCLATALVDIAQNDLGAILNEQLRCRPANPRCPPGDNRDLVV